MRCTLVVVLVVALAACSHKADEDVASTTNKKGECIEPSNPWAGDGGGHEAGFNWAQENHYNCPAPEDHGESFAEGCEEYYHQFNRYEACEAAKHK